MKKLGNITLLALTALLPLLILPLGEAYAAQTKQFLALSITLVVLTLMGIKLLIKKTSTLVISPFTPILAVFAAVIAASIFFTNSYPTDNLLGFGGIYLSLILIAWLGKGLVTDNFAQIFIKVLGISSMVMSLLSALQFFGYKLSWIYAESPIVAAQFLGIALVGYSSLIIINLKKSKKTTLLTWIAAVAIAAGFGLNLYSSLPNQPLAPTLPSLTASWSVALDVLRLPKTAILGVGPNNYHLAYARFKPAWLNQTKLWNTQFTQGYNLPLTLLVSTGVLGLVSWILLVLQILKQVKYNPALRSSPLTWMLLALLATQLVLPPFISLLVLFGLVLSAWLSLPAHKFKQKKYHQLVIQVLGVILLITTIFGSYGLGRATIADYKFFRANQAGQDSQMVEMYQLQQQAVSLNPYLASYRRRYALTNLSLATALANKTELTSEEQSSMLQLIQQSIRESQAAATLQPADVRNWQVLAQIYNNLANTITGADQWAVNSYVQAIQASPTNPDLRIALGNIFYSVDQFEQAEQLFAQAISLKPDHANAHYNLANALAKQDKLEAAVISYENVLVLVEPDSEDYRVAAAELAAIRSELN
jgi:cytochrome c-type biogenesis protein CcmH/NrfG